MIGTELGSYRIQSELGSGGMGTVYLAEVMEAAAGLEPGQKVALKVVHPHLLSTPGFFKRFLQEAEIGKKVRHENVVRTFDVDATLHEDKQVNYMVMEHVEGKSLRKLLIDLQTVPEALLREIALQTAAGLCAIHEQGIVHRDLKPENILITDDERVRIMDLGVAKLQEATIAITKEGQFAGSVLYAAPEQFQEKEVGTASDLYSLGVMLLELATGQNPFRRDQAGAVIQAHLTQEAPRASDQNPDISLFFSEVVATLLQKKAEDRFESTQALHDVLEEGEKSAWWVEREPLLRKRQQLLPKIRVRRETELHGRKDDLEALQAAWAKAKEGQGNTVFIEGEPGIGKTRLVDALVQTLEPEEVHVLYGSYPPSGGMGGLSAWLGGTARIPYVSGLDNYMPAALGKVHPKYGTPYISLIWQGIFSSAFILMAVIGSTIEEAYLVLVDATLVLYFIPYLYLFAAVVKLRKTGNADGVITIPGGQVGLYLVVGAGMFATLVSIIFSLIPGSDVASPVLFGTKVIGGSATFLLIGWFMYRYYSGQGSQEQATDAK